MEMKTDKPIRTVCGWCPMYGNPTEKVLVDVPEDERGLSHGICKECETKWMKGR